MNTTLMKRSGNYIIMEKGSCGYVRQREKDEMIIKKKIMMINKEQRGKTEWKRHSAFNNKRR